MLPLVISAIEDDGDREFITRLYKDHYHLMKQVALKFGAGTAADDMVQDALVKLIEKVRVLRSMSQPAVITYSLMTVKSITINRRRRKQVENRVGYQGDNEQAIDMAADMDANPSHLFFHKIKYEELYRAIRQLPDRDRELLMYKYFMDKTDREIGSLMGMKAEIVRTALSRARRRALELIRKEESANV